jgi:hypothetical protein
MFLTGAPPRFGAMPRVSRLEVMSTLFRPAPGPALLAPFPASRRTLGRMNTCDQNRRDEKKKEAMSWLRMTHDRHLIR